MVDRCEAKVLKYKYAWPRSALVKKSASGMVSVAVASATASSLGAATPVLPPRERREIELEEGNFQ